MTMSFMLCEVMVCLFSASLDIATSISIKQWSDRNGPHLQVTTDNDDNASVNTRSKVLPLLCVANLHDCQAQVLP